MHFPDLRRNCLQTSGAVRSRSADPLCPGLLEEVPLKRMRRFFRSSAVGPDDVSWVPVCVGVLALDILVSSAPDPCGGALPGPAWRYGFAQDLSPTFVYMFRPVEVYSGYTFGHLLPDIRVEASRVIFAARIAFSSLWIRSLERYGASALSRERC